MKLTMQVHGETKDIEIQRVGSRIVGLIGETRREVEVRTLGDRSYLFFAQARVYECRVEGDSPDFVTVRVSGHCFHINIDDPKRLRRGRKALEATHGASQIVARMPGKVVRLVVEKGATVKEGDPLLIVEAMKMQNELQAPKDGRVVEITTVPGATVNAGDVLATIE